MKIELKITKGNESRLFSIAPKLDEVFQAGGWNEFVYPSLKESKDYAAIDLFTGYEDSFDVIEYAYVEGSCVQDSVQAEETEFSYSYLVEGIEASYIEVFDALNTIDEGPISYFAYEDFCDGVWYVHFMQNSITVWTESHKTLEEVKTVYAGLDLEIAS